MAKTGIGGGFIPHLGVVLYPRPNLMEPLFANRKQNRRLANRKWHDRWQAYGGRWGDSPLGLEQAHSASSAEQVGHFSG